MDQELLKLTCALAAPSNEFFPHHLGQITLAFSVSCVVLLSWSLLLWYTVLDLEQCL